MLGDERSFWANHRGGPFIESLDVLRKVTGDKSEESCPGYPIVEIRVEIVHIASNAHEAVAPLPFESPPANGLEIPEELVERIIVRHCLEGGIFLKRYPPRLSHGGQQPMVIAPVNGRRTIL